jgi:hypothetical protein
MNAGDRHDEYVAWFHVGVRVHAHWNGGAREVADHRAETERAEDAAAALDQVVAGEHSQRNVQGASAVSTARANPPTAV